MKVRVVFATVLLLAAVAGSFSTLDEEEVILQVELAEGDYLAACEDLANATWQWLQTPTYRNYKIKLQADEDLARSRRSTSDSLLEFVDPGSLEDAGLRERVVLASTPGTSRLPLPEYREVVRFADRSVNLTQTQSVLCFNKTKDSNCTWDWQRSQEVLERSHDPYLAHNVWVRWHRIFGGQGAAYRTIRELLDMATRLNDAVDVWSYWQLLTDSPPTVVNASSLWADGLSSLYGRLRNLVLMRLRSQYGRQMVGDDDLLPLHLLGSFVGDDWLKIADLLMPSSDNTFSELISGLKKKGWGGRRLYEVSSGVGSKMGLPYLKKSPTWNASDFDGLCPTTVVPWCGHSYVWLSTCQDVGLESYLDAHRSTMAALYHQLATHNGRHILRQLNRQSPLLEAISGLGELVSLSSQQLSRLSVLPNVGVDTEPHLRFLVALRTLPRLAHALAADTWRAEGSNSSWVTYSADIKGVRPPRDVGESWEFVQDRRIALNQPYLSTFIGIILQFQLYEKLMEGSSNSTENPVDVIKQSGKLRPLMTSALTAPWHEVIYRQMGIANIDVGPLLRYLEPISELLNSAEETPASHQYVGLPPDLLTTTEQPSTLQSATTSSPDVDSSSSQGIEEVTAPTGKNMQGETATSASTSQTAILIGSLIAMFIGVATGAFLAGRHFYRRRKRRRGATNRRPS